jgi:adenylate kinase family enzyme
MTQIDSLGAKLPDKANFHIDAPILGSVIDESLYNGFSFNAQKYHAVDFNKGSGANSFVLIGPSGGGKDSRGDALCAMLGIKHKLSSGDIFRHLMNSNFSKDDLAKIQRKSDDLVRDGACIFDIAANSSAVIDFYKSQHIEYRNEKEAIAVFQALNGVFVEDSLYLEYARQQSVHAQIGKDRAVVYDGHIRRASQVLGMLTIARETHRPIDAALFVHTDMNLLERRLVGRLSCSFEGCGKKYNLTENPDSKYYPMDVFTGEDKLLNGYCRVHPQTVLTRRRDDNPISVVRRLTQYRDNVQGICAELENRGIPMYIVNGDLNPFSQTLVNLSVTDSLRAHNDAVRRRF